MTRYIHFAVALALSLVLSGATSAQTSISLQEFIVIDNRTAPPAVTRHADLQAAFDSLPQSLPLSDLCQYLIGQVDISLTIQPSGAVDSSATFREATLAEVRTASAQPVASLSNCESVCGAAYASADPGGSPHAHYSHATRAVHGLIVSDGPYCQGSACNCFGVPAPVRDFSAGVDYGGLKHPGEQSCYLPRRFEQMGGFDRFSGFRFNRAEVTEPIDYGDQVVRLSFEPPFVQLPDPNVAYLSRQWLRISTERAVRLCGPEPFPS